MSKGDLNIKDIEEGWESLTKTLQDIGPDGLWRLGSVDTRPDTGLLVVVDNWLGLLVVGDKSLLQSINVIVRSLDQWLASDVVLHLLLRRVEQLVVRSTGSWVDQSAGDTGNQQLVIDLELHSFLKRSLVGGQHLVELLGLRNGSWESVQNEPVLALLVVGQLILDHVDHDLIRNKLTLVHDLLGLNTKRSLLGNLRTQHVTSGQVTSTELLLEVWCLKLDIPAVQLHGTVLFQVQVHLEGVLQQMWLVQSLFLVAVELSTVVVVLQLVSVVWVGTLVNNLVHTLLWRTASQISKSVIGHNDVQIVLGVVNVRSKWNHTRNTSRIGLAWSGCRSVHDGQLGISQEISRSSQSVQHSRSVNVGGVGVRIDVNLNRSVHGNDTESSDDLWRVRHNLRSQTQLLGEQVPVVKELLESVVRQSDGGGSSIVHGTVLEEWQERVLQNLGPDGQVLELGVGQTSDNGIGNVTNTGLQWVQVGRKSAGLDLVLEEVDQVVGDLLGHFIWSSWVWDSVWNGGLDHSHNSVRVDRNGSQAVSLVHSGVWVWLSERRLFRHVNVVQTFKRRRGSVDFDNDFIGARKHLRRSANRRTRNNGTVLGDCGGLDDSVVQQVISLVLGVVTVEQILREHGQMLVKELGSVFVDSLCDWFSNLVRRTSKDHVICSPFRLFWTSRGAHKQIEGQFALQVVFRNVINQGLRNNFRSSHSGKPRPSEILAVFKERDTFLRGSEFLEYKDSRSGDVNSEVSMLINGLGEGYVGEKISLRLHGWSHLQLTSLRSFR
ncbi:hypothetical protein OGAPHI_002372 [Ogataea philodendri]|uniref:Uncharacterized protein n=1 Tax=Ogataea philodendri TaxID=1378263 RepID=A0A9P8PAD7_9ASCO|nr:uncharacterized protein OGAPHI_002372 [Ogataea philodendri]KAH3668618.1 hypothetical protein OGAPHI_002372 [Ogataea philodendri]